MWRPSLWSIVQYGQKGQFDGELLVDWFALDVTTGDVLWTSPERREESLHVNLFDPTHRLAIADGVALNTAGTAFRTVDGEVLWTLDQTLNTDSIISDGSRFVVLFYDGIRAYDPNSGRTLWTFLDDDLPEPPDDPFLPVNWNNPAVGDDRVFVNGEHWLFAFDAQTGAEIWRYRHERGAGGLAYRDGRLYAFVADVSPLGGVLVFDAASGEPLWRWSVSGGGSGYACPLLIDSKGNFYIPPYAGVAPPPEFQR